MKWKEQILNLRAYQPGKSIEEVKRQYQLDSIVKLASNENPFGYSPNVDTALKEFHSSFILYPDGGAFKLREATASLLGVNKDQLIFANGTDELVQIISRAMLEHGKNTVMATPTFPQYKHAAIVEGAEVREVELVNGSHDLNKMLAVIDENTAIVWVCSPNNPTGSYIPEDELRSFLESVPEDVLVVLDEAYFEYVNDSYNSLAFLNQFPNLIIMRTFSKMYGLASFRVGYGVSSATNIKRLEPVRLPFNTNVLGQLVASAAITDQDFVKSCRQRNSEEREKYYTFCQENELHYYPSQGNFILIDFGRDGDEVAQFLLSKGLIVRSGKSLGFPTSARITIGLEESNERVRSAIKELLEKGVELQEDFS
ncbi:histidinol-phosphate transaminase [Virgibacillus necropolis]|uniref:Histidinol-phosphate aminotransferase n=1 Tax=Virgibacillus necropolis TaxID=163877 RepID=A0A221MEL6_9BACI|nr:histidinol-phosphate transaminase [Virgibacillus necropolis]ASN06062.1 histidinol-phosphate transaminase [Virgibacillus necropolis]